MCSARQRCSQAYGSGFATGGYLGCIGGEFVGGLGLISGALAQDTECPRLKGGSGRA